LVGRQFVRGKVHHRQATAHLDRAAPTQLAAHKLAKELAQPVGKLGRHPPFQPRKGIAPGPLQGQWVARRQINQRVGVEQHIVHHPGLLPIANGHGLQQRAGVETRQVLVAHGQLIHPGRPAAGR